MATIPEAFPRRPLKITLPSTRMRVMLPGLLGILFLLGCGAALVNWVLPAIVTDMAVRDSAIAVRGRVEHGKCHSKLIFHICDVTLVNSSVRPEIRRDVTYVFTDLHVGSYNAQVMADPGRPALVTTDLGIDSLTSRILTMGACIALVLLALLMGLRGFFRGERRKAAVRAFSGQVLTPVPLTLAGFNPAKMMSWWTVKHGDKPAVRWGFPARARPFVIGSETNILGVVGPKGDFAVPLDSALSWVDFTEAERAAIRAAAQS